MLASDAEVDCRREAAETLVAHWRRGETSNCEHDTVELERAKRTGDPVGVLMLDVDHFKRVNDTHGHLIGDTVLREAAHRLHQSARTYDWVGRYGGEEFLVILLNCSAEDVKKQAERLRSSVADTPVSTQAGEINITASSGAAAIQGGDIDQEKLLQSADSALYRAKERGRDRVEEAEPGGRGAARGAGVGR